MVAMSSSSSLLALVWLGLILGASAALGAPAAVGASAATPAALPAATPVVGAQAATPVINAGAAANTALAAVPGLSACPQIAAFGPGTVVLLKDYSIAREMSILEPGGNASLGSISSPIYTYALTNELRSTTGSLVAKMVSPTVFWDTTADMYDCVNDMFAEIQWSTSNWWTRIFNPSMRVYDIYDASGNKVATMEHVKTGGGTHVASSVIALKVGGTIVMQLNMEPASWTKSVLGLFGRYGKATVSFMQLPATMVVPPLLKDPRFLSLIASAEIAPGSLGPFWTTLCWCLPWACLCCCCGIQCCGSKSKDSGKTIMPAEVIANANNEERARLMGPGEAGMKEAQSSAKFAPQQQGMVASFFNCCSRKAQPPAGGHGMAPV